MSKLRDLDMELNRSEASTSAVQALKADGLPMKSFQTNKLELDTSERSTVSFKPAELLPADEGKQLAALGLEKESMTFSGRANLATIASIVQQLGLTSARKAAILARVMQLRSQQWELDDSQERAECLRQALQVQIRALHQSKAELEEAEEAVKLDQASSIEARAEKEQKRMRQEMKAESYVTELATLQAKLKKVGFTEEVRHEGLKERHAALSAKQERTAALQARLAYFKCLPPDMAAAQQVHEETQEKLAETNNKFSAGLSLL